MGKKLSEIFKKYTPASPREEKIMNDGEVVHSVISEDKKRFIAETRFSRLRQKADLYKLEENLRVFYKMESIRISPKYDPALLNDEYFNEIFTEASYKKGMTRGMIPRYTVEYDGDTIILNISMTEAGMSLIENTNSAAAISSVINDEFGIKRNVELRRVEDEYSNIDSLLQMQAAAEKEYAERALQQLREHEQRAAEQDRPDREQVQKELRGKLSSLNEDDPWDDLSDPEYIAVGCHYFDISSPKKIYGEDFDIDPVPIRTINGQISKICVVGETFGYEMKELRGKEKCSVSFYVTDGDSTIKVRAVVPAEEAESFEIKDGTSVAVKGSVKIDTYERDYQLVPTSVSKIKRLYRKDNATEKRVELHLHTQMSQLEATIPPDTAVKVAASWGHKAVAITDSGNAQGYPKAMIAQESLAKEGKNIKVIYGIDGYFVDDTHKAAYGDNLGTLDSEFIVFDTETTGLSALSNRIIEIGAARVQGGEIKEIFETFVDPEVEIPAEITKLTGISQDMVEGAPKEEEAVRKFIEFIGDRTLIAHNAPFDTNFISAAAKRHNIPFDPNFIDTVPLSRYLNPELKRHKLDVVAAHYGLGDFEHHRAYADAEMLAMIFFKMCDKLRNDGIESIDDLNAAMAGGTDFLRQKNRRIVLLVKNRAGLKNLYKLISRSNLEFFYRNPQIPKSVLSEMRDGLIVGTGNYKGELFQAILDGKSDDELNDLIEYYDFLEIQPVECSADLVKRATVADEEQIRNINKRIVELGKKNNKPVCATTGCNVLDKSDEIGKHLLYLGKKVKIDDDDTAVHFYTTEEMLEEFSYLDDDDRYDVVIRNPNAVADMIEQVRPIPEGKYQPSIEGADDELKDICYKNMHRLYGDDPPAIVKDRLERELNPIIKEGFGVLYVIAKKLVENSVSKGYQVGSRGSVGSSFVATMANITEVNPLPPHYRCPECKHSEFITDGSIGSGFDLPEKNCPICGTLMVRDGHDIPFETFLGFKGNKSPDIDLNFSGDVQGDAHKYTEVLFGAENVFRAGTIGGIQPKSAHTFHVCKFIEDTGLNLRSAEIQHLVYMIAGCKRTTGQHPGGIIVVPREYEVYDFTPIQHPADDPKSDIITTHFAFEYLHDTILKLDILGHDVPTKYKMIEKYTGTNILDTPLTDPQVYKLFTSTEPLGIMPQDIDETGSEKPLSSGTFGLPELGTKFVRQMLEDAQPKNFADMLQISGLSHGQGVWLGNAQSLIKEGICDISGVIGTRDSIMVYLMHKGLEPDMAFKIMEIVRKGNKPPKVLNEEHFRAMREHNVPEWYIQSCLKIKYMFPKAHAAAYVISAIRLGYHKIYNPLEFYAAYFSAAPDGFDASLVAKGKSAVKEWMIAYNHNNARTQRDDAIYSACQLILEAMCRGIKFLPVALNKSDAKLFLPESGKIRIPYASLPGLGESAAENIANACRTHQINSVQDLKQYAKLSNSVIELLRSDGVLKGLDETNQITMFSMISGFNDDEDDN
ncbi:MAG: PolC-type DNA polymerase III [Clostridia bacterium]|nr:PolC-type DNA polymerase III [Clostridia bacterium]